MKHVLVLGFIVCALTLVGRSAEAQNGSIDPPAAYLDTTYPTQSGLTRTVCASGCNFTSLQSAINLAVPGDTITMPPGFVSERITLPAKTDNGQWIVIRSSSPQFDAGGLLPPGTRVDGRNSAHTSLMPIIRSSVTDGAAITTATGANHYRFVGIDIRMAAGVLNQSTIAYIGHDTSTTPAASDIIFDRVWVHGDPALDHRRGIALNGARMAVVDSHVMEFHHANDAQAVAAWNGPGPFAIINNRLEGADENLMFGGAPSANALMSPKDIEIRSNLLTKPLAWRNVESVKNILELKNATRVLVEGNILENTWTDDQSHAIVLTPRAHKTTGCTWCQVIDVTIRNNIIRNAAEAVSILGTDDEDPSGPGGDMLLSNNLFENIDYTEFGGGDSVRTILIGHGPQHVKFEHNTFINTTASGAALGSAIYLYGAPDLVGFVFRDNLMRLQRYGVFGPGVVAPGTATLNEYAPGWVFAQNGLANGTDGNSANHPTGSTGNIYLATGTAATTWEGQFVNYNGGGGGDYRLRSGHAYGANPDVGADIAAIEDATACAQDGQCSEGGGELVLLEDDFTGAGAVDSSKWTVGQWSGATQNPAIPVARVSNQLRIGPLPTSDTWNGVYSSTTYDFTVSGTYASVGIIQPAPGSPAYTMFAVGRDLDNYYRAYVNNGTLVFEREIGGDKQDLVTLPYNATQHAFLRIGYETGGAGEPPHKVVFATGPNNGSSWTVRYAGEWNTTGVPLSAVKFELKAGHSATNSSPGSAIYDAFRAAQPQ